MSDIFDVLFDNYIQSKVAGLSMLEAQTASRLTGTAERLQALEQKYERMHLVAASLWSLLKEHTGLTDTDLKRHMETALAREDQNRGTAGSMLCEKCHRRIRKSATRCLWCGAAVHSGDAFHGT